MKMKKLLSFAVMGERMTVSLACMTVRASLAWQCTKCREVTVGK